MRVCSIALLLAGCATTSPGAPPPLSVRSVAATACADLRVSDRRPGDPAASLPERWRAEGCGRRFECESFLLATREPAETRCVESDVSLDRRLRRVSAEQAVRVAGCPSGRVKVEGAITEADTRIYLVNACGRALRCVTTGARGAQEATRCTGLEEKER